MCRITRETIGSFTCVDQVDVGSMYSCSLVGVDAGIRWGVIDEGISDLPKVSNLRETGSFRKFYIADVSVWIYGREGEALKLSVLHPDDKGLCRRVLEALNSAFRCAVV